MPGVKLKFGKLEDFYDAIAAENNEHIPVVRGDMPDTWIHGFESMPHRNQDRLATSARWKPRWARSTRTCAPRALPRRRWRQALATAYENSLLYSEHTFGYYGRQPGGFWYGDEWKKKRAEGRYARFEQSFDDKRAYIHNTAGIVTYGARRTHGPAGEKRGRRRPARRRLQFVAVETRR